MDRYYKILGISSNASKEEIKQVYRTKMQALHPDKVHGTALEDTATFFTAEINEAYNYLMAKFDDEDISGNTNNQTGCVEEEIYVEGFRKLLYSLSNDIDTILNAMAKRARSRGWENIDLSIELDDIKKLPGCENAKLEVTVWTQNTILSENVKKLMNKHNVEYSLVVDKGEQGPYFVINRRIGDKWYIYTDIEIVYGQIPCIEEEILVGNELLKYSLSNNLDDIRKTIALKTGLDISLDNAVPSLNSSLSVDVKNTMNKYDVNYSMTTYRKDRNNTDKRHVEINRRVFDQWYTIIFADSNGEFHEISW